ncbi:MAG: LL-diaminopimelate aminotransferase [Planctomycetia bacterium]|nr:LL-diaminopimelate aminotransferase [Planctomycetia bacterium]
MAEPYFQELFADRIGGASYGKSNDIYKFEKIKRAKRQALADFPERHLIDFGIGENDVPAEKHVCEALAREVFLTENRGYADNGIIEFKEAAARFMKRRFGVVLDPVTQVIHSIGTKPALAMLPEVFINPGDITLLTVPGYPVAGTHTKYCGGQVHHLPLLAENHFYPDLDGIPEAILQRAKLLVLNYPNSPTGKYATADFYEKVVAFAKKHRIVVIQDAAHIMMSYEDRPRSFLETPGAMDVGVEIHSMSKGWNMIGWRMGWVCGNPTIVRAYGDVKDNSDSGQFKAIQKAAAVALDDDAIPDATRAKYLRRLKKLVAMLRSVGFQCEVPGGSYFLYTPSPVGLGDGTVFANAEACSQYLIRNGSICIVPWDDAGAFLRFSVTYVAEDEAAEDALMEETRQRLQRLNLKF